MDSFTNTGLLSLLQQVLRNADQSLVSDTNADPFQHSVTSDKAKRTLIETAMQIHGPGLPLSVGLHLDQAPRTPILRALLRSGSSDMLAQKFMRLEQFQHARHRTKLDTSQPNSWHCSRQSLGSPASFGENCLIAGFLVGLLQMTGHHDVTLSVGTTTLKASQVRTAQATLPAPLSSFAITFSERSLPDNSQEQPQHSILDRVLRLLMSDPAHLWRLEEAARAMTMSPRSLQRHLKQQDRSFSSVLRQARVHEAEALLGDPQHNLAEIAFCCGYADQPHFQRDFLRATNMTPAKFRQLA